MKGSNFMPIMKTDTHLIITHKVVGRDELVNSLGDMSLETTIMLEAHYLDDRAKKMGTPKLESGIEKAKKDRTNLQWLIRAYKAAKLTEPPIATDFGILTNYGENLTTIAAAIMDKCYLVNRNYARPHLMPDPDDWFIQLRLPLRSARVLKAMHRAIEDSEPIYRMSGPRTDDWDAIIKRTKELNQRRRPKLSETTKTTYTLEYAYEVERDVAQPQHFDTFTIPIDTTDQSNQTNSTEQHEQSNQTNSTDIKQQNSTDIKQQNQQNQQKLVSLIPTALFEQKTRRDLRHLILYGLVDLHILRHGGRGRPKQVCSISPVGSLLCASEPFQDLNVTETY